MSPFRAAVNQTLAAGLSSVRVAPREFSDSATLDREFFWLDLATTSTEKTSTSGALDNEMRRCGRIIGCRMFNKLLRQ